MKTEYKSLLLLFFIMVFSFGCYSQGGHDYTSSQERTAITIERGVITDVRVVNISNESSMVGPVAGGVAGGFLGSLLGSGRGSILGAVGGAAAGAIGGAFAEKGIRDKNAFQLTVVLDNGKEIAVVQDMDEEFRTGQRVRVLRSGDGSVRVQHE